MKDILEKINVVYVLIVAVVGVALIASVFLNQKEIALAAVTGLLGYLGGVATSTANKV